MAVRPDDGGDGRRRAARAGTAAAPPDVRRRRSAWSQPDGYAPLTLESAELDELYDVRIAEGCDETAAREALTPAMIAWLCERAPEALVVETGGASVRLATAAMLSSDEELDAFAADACWLAHAFVDRAARCRRPPRPPHAVRPIVKLPADWPRAASLRTTSFPRSLRLASTRTRGRELAVGAGLHGRQHDGLAAGALHDHAQADAREPVAARRALGQPALDVGHAVLEQEQRRRGGVVGRRLARREALDRLLDRRPRSAASAARAARRRPSA